MREMSSLQKSFFKKHSSHRIAALLLQQGETVQIPLTGSCMKPLLCEKDLLTIYPLKAEQLRCGDVAVYLIHGELKTHRFLKSKSIDKHDYLITKSDRRYHCDKPVPYENLLGKIIQIQKGNKLVDYTKPNWAVINYLLGKLSPYISFFEYLYNQCRGFIVTFMRYTIGYKNTARIKKIIGSHRP